MRAPTTMRTLLKSQGMRTAALSALLLTAWLLTGCAASPSTASADLHPRTLDEVQESTGLRAAHNGERRPTVALAQGGGGLRGFAHVGVLQALEEAGLRPHIEEGNTAGSVVGPANCTTYVPLSFVFVANRTTTRVSFRDVSLTTTNIDLVLENVRVTLQSAHSKLRRERTL